MEQGHKDMVQEPEEVKDVAEALVVALAWGLVANAVAQIAGIRRHIDWAPPAIIKNVQNAEPP